jgi:carboxymethylenebutenolidase
MKGRMVQFSSNSGTTPGYLSIPEKGSGPAVVVIQEWWGLVDHIKDVCDRFAAEGYVALAPDLYHGETTKSPDEAGKMMMSLKIDQAEKDLRGAVDFLLGLEATTGDKVGIVGFCMGGAFSLYAASKNDKVGACVVFYGIHPNVKPDLQNLKAPVLGIYAEHDQSTPPEAVRDLEEKLKALGKSVEMHIYPNVGHAFFNDTRPQVYDARSAEHAWRRTIEFLAKNL